MKRIVAKEENHQRLKALLAQFKNKQVKVVSIK